MVDALRSLNDVEAKQRKFIRPTRKKKSWSTSHKLKSQISRDKCERRDDEEDETAAAALPPRLLAVVAAPPHSRPYTNKFALRQPTQLRQFNFPSSTRVEFEKQSGPTCGGGTDESIVSQNLLIIHLEIDPRELNDGRTLSKGLRVGKRFP